MTTITTGWRHAQAARSSVSLQCVTTDGGEKKEQHFGITFDVGASRWMVLDNTSHVFSTKRGNYVTVSNTTSLRKDGGTEVVGTLQGFNPSTAQQGASRSDGKAVESGRIFKWTVDLIVS